MASTPDEILEELRAHRREIATIFASGKQDASGVDAAKEQEAEATKQSAAAVSYRAAAKKAMDDGDDEDAAAQTASAHTAQLAAVGALEAAKRCYEAAAKELAASDETASKDHEANATRLQAAMDAAKALQASDEAASKMHEEAAAKMKKRKGMMPVFAAMLSAMQDDDDDLDAMKDADNLSLLKHMMAMVYPAGPRLAKRNQSAAHDDTAEDTALFKRLMKQYKDGDSLSASGVTDIQVARKLRSLEAAMGEMSKLITDMTHAMRDLATDKASTERGLATDKGGGVNGGPVRKTMSATGGDYRGKFDDQKDTRQTEKEIDAQLDDQNLGVVERLTAKLMLMHNNQVQQ